MSLEGRVLELHVAVSRVTRFISPQVNNSIKIYDFHLRVDKLKQVL
jgi:hypothetical protein